MVCSFRRRAAFSLSVLLFGSCWLSPSAVTAQESYTLNFAVQDGEAIATGLSWSNSVVGFVDSISIPASYELDGTNYPVTRVRQTKTWDGVGEVILPDSVTFIEPQTFAYRSALTNVVFGSGLTNIGFGAFTQCTNLRHIVLPDSVTGLGESVFSDSGVQTAVLGDGLVDTGDSIFSSCTQLTSVSFGSALERVGLAAFSGCSALTDVVLPDSVRTIENSAFYFGQALTNLYLGTNLTHIGALAFSECTALVDIVIPPTTTNIGPLAFARCSSLTTVTMSPTVIGDRAFLNCGALTSITLQDGLERIGVSAFENGVSLTEVHVPDSTLIIGASAFAGCTSVTNATLPSRFAAQVGTIGFSGDLATRLMADGLAEAIALRIVEAVADNNYGIALKSELGGGGSNDLTAAIQTILANPAEYDLYDGTALTNQYQQGFTNGVSAGETNVLSDPASFSLYTESSIQDLRFGGLIMSRDDAGMEVEFEVEQADDLAQTNAWTVIGTHTNAVSDVPGKSFIRVRAKDSAPQQP